MQVHARGKKTLAPLTLSIAAFIAAISVAVAQSVPPNVAQRQHGMKAIADAAKSINAMFKGTSPYDSKLFKAAAETIRSQSGTALSALFPGVGHDDRFESQCEHRIRTPAVRQTRPRPRRLRGRLVRCSRPKPERAWPRDADAGGGCSRRRRPPREKD
nr:cytochrome c [Sinorhizobium meliloti]